jgi:integrase
MRVEEICQLHISDIKDIDGVTCFSINEKWRLCPVQQARLKHWQASEPYPFIAGCGRKQDSKSSWKTDASKFPKTSGPLLCSSPICRNASIREFSSVQFSAGIIHWFTRYRRVVGVGGQEGETSSKTFHSFRHTVVEYLLKEARVPLNMVQTVVGHEVTDMGGH